MSEPLEIRVARFLDQNGVWTMTATIGELEFMCWLKSECGYMHLKPLPDRKSYAGIWPLMFTYAIIVGTMGNHIGFDDRWCYSSYEKAKAALDAWDGTGEPQGWHRHPGSGRRRTDGDPAAEYVAP